MSKLSNVLVARADIPKLIKSALTSTTAMRNALQKVAVAAIGYANLHQDIDVARDVYAAFKDQKGVQAQRLLDYIAAHGCVVFDPKNQKKPVQYTLNPSAECADVAKLLESLDESKWFEFKAEKADKLIDVKDVLEKLIKRASAALDAKQEVLNAELLDGLVELLRPREITAENAVKAGGMMPQSEKATKPAKPARGPVRSVELAA